MFKKCAEPKEIKSQIFCCLRSPSLPMESKTGYLARGQKCSAQPEGARHFYLKNFNGNLPKSNNANSTQEVLPVFSLRFCSLKGYTWYPRLASLHKIYYFSLNPYISINYIKYISHSFRTFLKIIAPLIANLRGIPKKPKERPINRPPYQYWITKQFIVLLFLFISSCQPQPVFAEQLKASWYSVESLKRDGQWKITEGRCADGSLFKDSNFTCATWLFPLHSRVRIICLKNGNTVDVIVSDRINRRYAKTRVDVTPAVMEALMGKQGLKAGLIDIAIERIK